MRINKTLQKHFPNNCAIIEEDGDGNSVGACWFYIDEVDGCPRHGFVSNPSRQKIVEKTSWWKVLFDMLS